MNSFFWQLPRNLLVESVDIMRPHGAVGNEGLALWFGTATDQSAQITHIVEVFGEGFRNHALFMQLSLSAMASLTDLADSLNVALVGQIHSHPGLFIDLSQLDIAHGIRSPSYLSLVCPHYAQFDISSYDECGVHVFEDQHYRRLSPKEIERRLKPATEKAVRIRHQVWP
jgi:proteasome lid subunit RPN8/RPN11